MALTPKVISKLNAVLKSSYLIYTIVIIITIPLLLVVNTFWNLRSFNRDVNFLIRHQAVSVADTIKPQIVRKVTEGAQLNDILMEAKNSNSEIISISVIEELGHQLSVIASTIDPNEAGETEAMELNQLALSLDQPVAGLNYDPKLAKNVWNVSVPMQKIGERDYLLYLKFRVDKVEEILGRTARDSYMILSILVIITLILLVNHFIFYTKAQKTRELEELDKLKDEFISMAAHELKAPMTGLVGYLELLSSKISPAEKEKIKEDFETSEMLTVGLKYFLQFFT